MTMCQVRTNLGMTHEARKEKQNKVPTLYVHMKTFTAQLRTSCQVQPGRHESSGFPTRSRNARKARFQPDPQHQICALRRSTPLHSWHVMPSDLLFQLTRFCIGHFTTGNLERQLRETTCLSGAPSEARDTEKRACNHRTTREETTNKHSIVIHIKR